MGLLYTRELACRKQLFRIISKVSFLAVPVNRNATAVFTVVKVKVALLSITLHVKTYKGIEKNVSHSPTVKHISAHAQQQIRQDI